MMNKCIKNIILRQTDQRKAEMACELNRWQWPKELKKFDPGNYPMGRDYKKGIDIIEYIEHVIGHKAFLKEWNKNDMTEEQFESWYRKNQ
jgi:hypothetical protein